MLWKIAIAVRVATWTVSARQALALGNSQKAAFLIERAYSALGANPAAIEMDLLRSMVAIKVENGPLALASAEHALSELSAGAGRYKAADRTYLKAFAEELIRYCHSWRDNAQVVSKKERILELSEVSGYLKKNYPMTSDGRFATLRTLH